MGYTKSFKVKRWLILYKRYKCTLDEFKINKLYKNNLKVAEMNLLSFRISKEMGITEERAKFKIEQAERMLQISIGEYYTKKYYKYTNYHLIEKLYSPTYEEKLDKMATIVGMRMGCDEEEAKGIILKISKTYNISPSDIMKQCYYKCSSEIIKDGEKKYSYQARINIIAEACSVDYEQAKNRMKELEDLFGICRKKEVVKFFHLTNAEIFQRMDMRDENRVKKLVDQANATGKNIAEFWHDRELTVEAFGTTRKLYKGFLMWEKTDEEIGTFILGSDMYYMMNKYNRNADNKILANKLLFAREFKEVYGREFWINNESATYQSFENFAEMINYGDIIIKPANGLKGKGIEKLKLEKDTLKEVYDYLMSLGLVVVDECVVQHEKMAKLGAGAVNTIRVLTVYDGGKCNIIYAVVRVGMNDVVDNFHSGGYIARINKETGIIESNGYPLKDAEYIYDPCSNEKINGYEIPHWNKVVDLVTYSSSKIKHIGYVGWDVAISQSGEAVLIEGNPDAMTALVEYSYKEREKGHREQIIKFLDEK